MKGRKASDVCPTAWPLTTPEECEKKLKVLIVEMKKEIAEIKAKAKNEG